MKSLLICLALLPALAFAAIAQTDYDRKLEDAVKFRIAGKIGGIRLGFKPGDAPRIEIAPEELVALDKPAPPEAAKSWQIVRGDAPLNKSASGSFQSFSDGSTVTPEQRRAWAKKTVSRVINF